MAERYDNTSRFNRARLLLGVAITALIILPAAAQTVTGKVVGIADGDTLTILTPQRTQLKVRLDGIDAPEDGQEFSAASKRALSALTAGKTVTLQVSGTDRYERTLGTVIADGQNVNLVMVRAGFAWHYLKYSDDPDLAAAEKAARSESRGLWAGLLLGISFFIPSAPFPPKARGRWGFDGRWKML